MQHSSRPNSHRRAVIGPGSSTHGPALQKIPSAVDSIHMSTTRTTLPIHPASSAANTWDGRPRLAFFLRILTVVTPLLASMLTTAAFAVVWSGPTGPIRVIWWVGLLAVGTLTMLIVDRIARRLLPLATLLQLSLVFPDQAPSRFGVAIRSSTSKQLERRVAEYRANGVSSNEIEAAQQLIELVAALGRHDRFTRGHGERVRAYSALIGEELGLNEQELSKLRWAGLIHDIGKLDVPSEILNKEGRLTEFEFEIIKTHPAAGAVMAEPLRPWLGEWVDAVGQHHERVDGGGYPLGLVGREISLGARIVSVADTFDVITAARSYKKPRPPQAAREELTRCAGSQFDEEVVRAFLTISTGRLRRVMGPLSWFAHLPYLAGAASTPALNSLFVAAVAVGTIVGGTTVAGAADGLPFLLAFSRDSATDVASVDNSLLATSPANGLPANIQSTIPTGDPTSPPPTLPSGEPPTSTTEPVSPEMSAISDDVAEDIQGTTGSTTTPRPTLVPPAPTSSTLVPPIALPPIALPPIALPTLDVPLLDLPPISLPPISLPPIVVPPVTVPNIPLVTPPLPLPEVSSPPPTLVPPIVLPPVLPKLF